MMPYKEFYFMKKILTTLMALTLSVPAIAKTPLPDLSQYTYVLPIHSVVQSNQIVSKYGIVNLNSFLYKKDPSPYDLNENMNELLTCASLGHICLINKNFTNKDVLHLSFNDFKIKYDKKKPLMVTDGVNYNSKYLYLIFPHDPQTYYMKNHDFPTDSIDEYMSVNAIEPFHLATEDDASTAVKIGGTAGAIGLHVVTGLIGEIL